MKKISCLLFALGVLTLGGCVGPISRPSALMQKAAPVLPPPPGQSLVLIHRPRNAQGYGLYTGVWDGRHFIADLGNGNSTAYVCEPGRHYFINRSVERIGVVEADLLPDKIYMLRLGIAGVWIASFQLEPMKRGDRSAEKIAARCEKENAWVGRGSAAAAHETLRQPEIELILKDFVNGDKRDRLRHLGPDDYR